MNRPELNRKEKRLLIMAGLLFLLVVVVRLVPAAVEYYQEGRAEVLAKRQQVDRLRRLVFEADRWRELEELKRLEVEELKAQVFEGSNPNLIGSSIQRELRRAADAANVTVREMSVARFEYLDGWVRINQQMNFTISQENILPFLRQIEEARPRMLVSDFTINRGRREYTGSLTVSGFSKRPGGS